MSTEPVSVPGKWTTLGDKLALLNRTIWVVRLPKNILAGNIAHAIIIRDEWIHICKGEHFDLKVLF